MDAGYLKNRKEEALEIKKTTFWQDYIEEINKLREKAVSRCVENSDIKSMRRSQGAVRAIDKILNIPTDLYNEKHEDKQGITD